MVSSAMLRRVPLVRTDVSEELSAPFIRVTRIGEVRTLAVTSNPSVVPSSPILVTLMKKALSSPEKAVLARATRRNIPEDIILPSFGSPICELEHKKTSFKTRILETCPV
jgi:hypothetical protein